MTVKLDPLQFAYRTGSGAARCHPHSAGPGCKAFGLGKFMC